jgi:hypothetical protein
MNILTPILQTLNISIYLFFAVHKDHTQLKQKYHKIRNHFDYEYVSIHLNYIYMEYSINLPTILDYKTTVHVPTDTRMSVTVSIAY